MFEETPQEGSLLLGAVGYSEIRLTSGGCSQTAPLVTSIAFRVKDGTVRLVVRARHSYRADHESDFSKSP